MTKAKDNMNRDFCDDDDFWDIDSLMPKTKSYNQNKTHQNNSDKEQYKSTLMQFSSKEEVNCSNQSNDMKIPNRSQSSHMDSSNCILSYKPKNPLILNVKLYQWSPRFGFYQKFLFDAQKYANTTSEKCEYVNFTSYMPQFNQLPLSALKYYIYFRNSAKEGVYIKSNISYIVLFFYELINLDNMPPAQKLDIMCALWRNYRNLLLSAERMIAEWICDFCLINALEAPIDKLPFISELLPSLSLCEFYFTKENINGEFSLEAYIKSNSSYDFTKSMFITNENKYLFETHINAAVLYSIKKTQNIEDGVSDFSKAKITRESYNGALCVFECKKKIEIEFYSFNHSYKFKKLISGLQKYSENNLRYYLGIKARLNVPPLPDNMKEAIDEYFNINLQLQKKSSSASQVKVKNEWEHFYEAPQKEFSIDSALEIEQESWEITKILAADDLEQEDTEGDSDIEYQNDTEYTDNKDCYIQLKESLTECERKILSKIAEGDTVLAQREAAKSNLMLDAVIDSINEKAVDITGDIIIENYEIIEDYKDLLLGG